MGWFKQKRNKNRSKQTEKAGIVQPIIWQPLADRSETCPASARLRRGQVLAAGAGSELSQDNTQQPSLSLGVNILP